MLHGKNVREGWENLPKLLRDALRKIFTTLCQVGFSLNEHGWHSVFPYGF
jgi:hypothetical protein